MKMIVWVALLATVGAFAFTATADAQGYYSQRARQDRDYRSMSAATQRAYGTTSRTTTYSTQSYSSSSRKPYR